jgi:peptidyl-prolyl cis-trans isomerase D
MDTQVSEEAVTGHYEENKERYSRPERVAIEYLEVSRSRIADRIPVDDAELLKLYQARQANYGTPEQRKVRHILLSLPSDADESAVAEARNKLLDVRRQIESGTSFESMAQAHSEDTGTAENGGDLGFISRGIMDAAFEAAAFSLGAGEVSEPIRSSFGLHLIQVSEIREGRTRSFEQVKPQLKTEVQNEQADLEFSEQVERLANLAFEHPESLEVAAETLGLEIKSSEPFSREGSPVGIASNPKVVSAAFGEDVLGGDNNSELLELDNGVVVVLRVTSHEPSAPLPLDEVRDRITQDLKLSAAREKAGEVGRSLLEKLNNGEDPMAVAESGNVQWSEIESLSRITGEADQRLRSIVFRMPKPGDQSPSYAGHLLSEGGFQIVALESVTPGPVEGQEDAPEDLRRSLAAEQGSAALQEYSQALRDNAEVVINQENLQGRL